MALEPYEASLGVLLRRWAEEAPDRVFLAERPGDGDWVELTWGEANRKASAIAQALLDRGLGPERPLLILSGNSIDHALLTLGGFLAGVPVVPVSPAYSLMSQDYGKVKHIAALVKPGLVYAADAGPFGGVLSAVDFGGAEIVLSKGTGATPFGELLDTPADRRGRRGAEQGRPRQPGQGPVHQRLDGACPRACSTRTGCCAPTSSRSRRSGPSRPRRRRCSWTGCRGTTPSAATTTST